jgi:hypothetical protein
MISQHCFINRFDASMQIFHRNIEMIILKKNIRLLILKILLNKNSNEFDQCGGRRTICLVCRRTNRKNLNEKKKNRSLFDVFLHSF